MIINLSEIMSVEGQVKNIQTPFELEVIPFNNMEYKVFKSSPIDITIAHIGKRKVELYGKTKITILIPCNRCLEESKVDFDVFLHEKLDFESKDEDEINALKEANYLNEYNLDLDLMVYEEIILDFPMKVLCEDDCKGLCSSCGTNLNKGVCGCDTTSLDPRMAAIQDIFNEFKEV